MPDKAKMISTGIPSLDPILGGGFIAGTSVLLMGELGTGYDEFLVTSTFTLAGASSRRMAPPSKEVRYPEEVWWVTFMSQPAELIDEISDSFSPDFSNVFQKYLKVKDFFPDYARTAPFLPKKLLDDIAKSRGKAVKSPKTFEEIGKVGLAPNTLLMESLMDFLNKHAPDNMVVIHTLTDLARMYRASDEEWRSFLLFLHWIRRSVKRWGGVVYTTLMKGFLDPRMEAEILPCFDDILLFERETSAHAQRRVVSLSKSKKLSLAIEEVAKLEIKVSPQRGLVIERVKVVTKLK